jgi:U3 small nucleolar RNA-associated protein 25
VFYQLPTFPQFYSELVNLMHPSYQGKKFTGDENSMTCTAMFCRQDVHALAAVVGTEKAGQMLRAGDSKNSTTFIAESAD